MIDNQFDNFVNGKLKDHAAPVPAGLWDKVTDAQFDNFISDKLRDYQAPVPADLWGKITDTQFDSFVGNKLISHVAPLPAGLWEKIHPEEKDFRKGFLWFRNPAAGILMLALLLAGSLGGYLYFTADKVKTHPTGIDIQKAGKTESNEKAGGSLLPDDQPAGVPSATDTDQDQPGINETISKDKSKATDEDLNRDAIVSDAPAGRNTSSEKNTNPPASANNSLTLNNPSSGSNRPGWTLEPINPKINNAAPAYKDVVTNSHNNKNNITTKNSTSNSSTDRATSINQSREEAEFEFIEPYHSNLFTAVTIPSAASRYTGLLKLSDKQLLAGNHTSHFKNVIICPSDRKNRNTDWHLELYTSPDMAFRSLTNVSASQQYLLRKDSSETMQVGYTAGIRLVKPITDNIMVKAGVQYTQMNEKFVYRTENEIKTTTVVTLRTIIRAPGDTVIVSDTSIVQQIGFKNNTVKNRFRSFDIPVTIGYQFGNEDLKVGINAGVIFNVSSWYQGVILDSSLGTVPLTKSNSMVYKSNIGLGLYAGVSVVKRLSDDLHVFVEPYFRYNLSNMTSTQSSYHQKFSLGGVSLGLRFNLNRQ